MFMRSGISSALEMGFFYLIRQPRAGLQLESSTAQDVPAAEEYGALGSFRTCYIHCHKCWHMWLERNSSIRYTF